MNSPLTLRSPVFLPAAIFSLALLLSWVAALLCSPAAVAQIPARPADKELTGAISGTDHQSYKRIPFTLPEGVDRLVVAFDYDGREAKTVIDLGMEDPNGFRGASGGSKQSFTISETDATPSYLPGRLVPGEWALSLAIPNIRDGEQARWTARLWFLKGAEAQSLPAPTEGRGPGWYRGDLHLHSAHSDGSCDSQSGTRVPCPLFRTLEAAAARGLDYVAVTEHNSVSHAHMLREAQPYFDKMLLITGREITTFQGHFNIFGISEPIDFRIAHGIDNSFNRIADRVHALGGIVSVNHPALPSGEICMGCGWTMPDVDYSKVDAVEIVTGAATGSAGGNVEGITSGLPFWLEKSQAGGRLLAAIGGSDNHDPDKHDMGAVASPVTTVFARDLSQQALFDGIRSGRAFITIDPAMKDVHLDFSLQSGRKATSREKVLMGGAFSGKAGEALSLMADVKGPAGSVLEIMNGANRISSIPLTTTAFRSTLPLSLGKGMHIIRLQLRGADGSIIAYSNAVQADIM